MENNSLGPENKKEKIIALVIYCAVFLLLPTIIGVVLTIALKNPFYIEVFYVIFGALAILYALLRSWLRDGRNFKKNKTLVEDKNTIEYKDYHYFQIALVLVGIAAFILALISFLICKAVYA